MSAINKTPEEAKKGPEVNWVAAAGSGLGSVTSAVLVSSLGASGTVIGAGIGTFVITVGGTIYGYYLQRAKTNIEDTTDKIKRPQSKLKQNSAHDVDDSKSISAQKDATTASESAPDQHKSKPTFGEVLRNIRWKRVVGLAAALFAFTMAVILIFELATGRPVSSYTGGTSPDSTGNSITGVTDPAQDTTDWTPGEDTDQDVEQPEQTPAELDEQPVPEEAPEPPVEQDVPEQQQPEQAPPQQEPLEAPGE